MDTTWLHEEAATDMREVGSKAAGLARLGQLKLDTPPGFVITVTSFQKFIDRAGLAPELASLASCSSNSQLEQLMSEVSTKIRAATYPPDVERAIKVGYEKLSGKVAVRSSGIAEDGGQSAFAGAYASFLNRTTEEEVLTAIRDCWASAFSPRVAAYRMQHQLAGADWHMGVIVQDMIVADKAGVLFTRNPYDDDNTMLVEALPGGCEQIVSGAPASLSLWIGRESRKLKRVEQAASAVRRFGSGAVGLLGRPTEQGPRLLRRREIELLVDTGLLIEREMGQPQDIEWAIANGRLVLLQARPLTAYRYSAAEA